MRFTNITLSPSGCESTASDIPNVGERIPNGAAVTHVPNAAQFPAPNGIMLHSATPTLKKFDASAELLQDFRKESFANQPKNPHPESWLGAQLHLITLYRLHYSAWVYFLPAKNNSEGSRFT